MLILQYANFPAVPSRAVKHDLAQAVRGNLNGRFGEVEKIKELALATLLDLRFKANGFCDLHFKNEALEILVSELVGLHSPTNRDQPPRSQPNPTKRPQSSLWEHFDKDVAQYEARDTTTYPDIAHTHLHTYLNLPCHPRHTNPFNWWQQDQHLVFGNQQRGGSSFFASWPITVTTSIYGTSSRHSLKTVANRDFKVSKYRLLLCA
ncbi:hypothetical protein TCAL_16086 [Tigriopus californicus]|uniref:HAT C-terminal dimerisation domain-containing protein n=1 Tax=Tigriopus californicus TaxID=6832 RepID=A0A553PNM3_TIGCA|nr:hypothetical protein TCAL_16086 [Tigriopus californicus]